MVRISSLLLLLLLLLSACLAQPNDNHYDDTRRSSCMQAKNSFTQENPDIIEQANSYNKAARTILLAKDPTSGKTVKQTFPEDDTAYRRACETANGIFVSFIGILDCQTSQATTDVSIIERQAYCYPPGPECQHYTTVESRERGDMQLDTERMFDNHCTLRGNDSMDHAITYSTEIPLPEGKARFQFSDPDYNIQKRQICQDAITQSVDGYLFGDAHRDKAKDALNTARIDQINNERVETLQEFPVLTQRISHPQEEEDPNLPTSYQSLCEQSGGRYSNFSGVLDCVGLGVGDSNVPRGATSTTIIENAANCFPATGCEGYTMERWKLDTLRHKTGQSCVVRGESNASITTTTSNSSSSGALMGLALALGVVAIIAAVSVQRRRQQQRRILETAGQGPSYSDNDETAEDDFRVELPSIS